MSCLWDGSGCSQELLAFILRGVDRQGVNVTCPWTSRHCLSLTLEKESVDLFVVSQWDW